MPKATSDPIPTKEKLQLWALQSGCSPNRALKKQPFMEAMLEAIRKRPVLKRWVLSIDIGYRNFAYCLMDNNDKLLNGATLKCLTKAAQILIMLPFIVRL